jgi:general secretion pathway protein A
MYLKQFGFQEKPFHITPNPRFIFLSKNHKDAFAHLLYGIRQRVGFLSLTGEVGTGKTTVLRTLLGQLGDEEYRLALILNPCLSALELMETIHREFSLACPDRRNLGQLHESLNRFLLEQREAGRTVVLVVDEAQNLEPAVLEQLRLLSNLETETDKLIQMVLVGQPELEALFDRPDLRQLRQRLVVRYRLLPMDAEDSEAYIRHRLKVAGWQGGSLFDARALKTIYRLTGGTPRLINMLCDRALLVAYSRDLDRIDRRVVNSARLELRQAETAGERPWRVRIPLLLTVLLTVLIGLGLLWPRLFENPAALSRAAAVEEVAAARESVTPGRIEELQQRIAALDPERTATRALSSLLAAWGKQPPDPVRRAPETVLREQGLLVSRFQGDLDGLLTFNAPALVELMVPTLPGSQFFSLLGYRDGRLLLEPGLTASGWIAREEFERIWFGKAFIPWLNPDRIAYLMEPGIEQPDVARLQDLLRTIGFDALSPTGRFDPETIRAVTTLQRRHRLIPDGRVGPQTLLLIYRLAGAELPELTERVSL